MGSDLVVMPAPASDIAPGFSQVPEPMQVQAAGAEFAIETLTIGIFSWFAGADETQHNLVV